MLTLLAETSLLVCALLLAGQSYRRGEKNQDTASFVISLSAAFLAAASLGSLTVDPVSQDMITFQRLLDNLAFYAALPLLGSALICQAWQQNWSRAAWGRWLLALFALFELMRRAEQGDLYSQLVAVATVLLLLASLPKLNSLQAKFTGLITALPLSMALLVFSHGSLIPQYQSLSGYALALAAALLLLTWQQRLLR